MDVRTEKKALAPWILGVVLIVLGGLWAVSHLAARCNTTQGPGNASATQSEAAPNNHAGAEDAGAFVKVVQAIYESVRAQSESGRQNTIKNDWFHSFLCDLKIGEWAVSLFTLLLFVVTTALALYTFRLWRETRLVAEKQHQLELSQFRATNRPRLVVRRPTIMRNMHGVAEYIRYSVHNLGSTDCTITRVYAAIWFPGGRHWPDDDAYGNPEEKKLIVRGGESAALLCSLPLEHSDKIAQLVGYMSRKNVGPTPVAGVRVCFLGLLKYVDEAGITRQTGFLRQFDWETKSFAAVENQDYEYAD